MKEYLNYDQFLPIYDNDVDNKEIIEIENFEIGNVKLNISITPAIVKTSQGNKIIFPSIREKLIERALRLIILKKGLADKEEDESIPINFTLNELKEQLEKNGHFMTYEEIKEGLSVMRNCDIEVRKSINEGFEHTFGGPILDIKFQVEAKEDDKDNILFRSYFHPSISQFILK
jgi:hypothetical protein